MKVEVIAVHERITSALLHEHEREAKRVEVLNGQIVESERVMTIRHVLIIQTLYRLLDAHVRERNLGLVLVDGARYILAGQADDITRARVPDLSFVGWDRLPDDLDGDFVGAPDFAVEVISPGQTNAALLQKVADYLYAGCEEVWLIDPGRETLSLFRRDEGGVRVFGRDDRVETAFFAGLDFRLAMLLAPPQ